MMCVQCDGRCVICDSYVRPCTLVRICEECNYGSYAGRCVICGGPGTSDAYYCKVGGLVHVQPLYLRTKSTTLRSAPSWRRTGTGVRRSSTSGVRRPTSSTNARN